MNDLIDQVKSFKVLGPLGEPAKGPSQEIGRYRFFEGIDPRWDSVQVEVELTDPAAPPEATGEFERTLEFKDVPIPPEPNQPLPLKRTLTSPLGTQVTLESAAVLTQADKFGQGPGLLFTIGFLKPESVPDLAVIPHHWVFDAVIDDRGVNLSQQRGWNGRNSRWGQPSNQPLTRLDRWTFVTGALPSPEAKTVNVKIEFREEASSLKQMQWFRHFRLALKRQDIKDSGARAPFQPLAQAEGEHVKVELESLQPEGLDRYKMRFWVDSRSEIREPPQEPQPREPQQAWLLQQVRLTDDLVTAFYLSRGANRTFNPWESGWKADGSLPRPHETSVLYSLSRYIMDPPEPAPSKLTLEADVVEARRAQSRFDFTDLPVPPPGQSAEVHKMLTDASGAQLILHRIGYYTAGGPPPDWKVLNRTFAAAPTGLAALFEFRPAGGRQTSLARHELMAHDNAGRALLHYSCDFFLPLPENQWFQNYGTSLVNHQREKQLQDSYEYTLLLLPPAREVKSFTIRVFTDEVITTERRETVVLKDIPVPPPPLKPNATGPYLETSPFGR
ncbi:MAG: hypothetical protein M3347_17255 [Armatimonadota bacterium]|nr:hypothetical protein [Armatimonadota bacterium]